MKTWESTLGNGRTQVTLHITDTGNGLEALFTGGERAHVGAVVMSLPRRSLADNEQSGCDTYVLPVPGHKDDVAGKIIGECLCKAVGVPVAVTCGVHSDQMTCEEIQCILTYADALCKTYLCWTAFD